MNKGKDMIQINKIPKQVKKLRENLGWTQAELAKVSGLTRPSIEAIERGTFAPSMRTLNKLSYAFKIQPQDLMCVKNTGKDKHHTDFFNTYSHIEKLNKKDLIMINNLILRLIGSKSKA